MAEQRCYKQATIQEDSEKTELLNEETACRNALAGRPLLSPVFQTRKRSDGARRPFSTKTLHDGMNSLTRDLSINQQQKNCSHTLITISADSMQQGNIVLHRFFSCVFHFNDDVTVTSPILPFSAVILYNTNTHAFLLRRQGETFTQRPVHKAAKYLA